MSKHVKLMAAIAAVAVLLVGCGGKETVSPESYMTSLCTEMGDWLTGIRSSVKDLGNEITPTMTPAQGKDALGAFLDDVIGLTQEALDGVKAAGIPDAEGGEEIATKIQGAFEQAKKVFEDARAKVDELPTDDPAAFQGAATQLGTSIQDASSKIGGSLGGVKSPELDKAARNVTACTDLNF